MIDSRKLPSHGPSICRLQHVCRDTPGSCHAGMQLEAAMDAVNAAGNAFGAKGGQHADGLVKDISLSSHVYEEKWPDARWFFAAA